MTNSLDSLDAETIPYEEIFRLLAEEELTLERGERRSYQRSEYNGWQLIAPYRGRRPLQCEFKFIVCRDLSASGFSFIASEDMQHEEYVIALGAAPFRFFIAEVANQRLEGESGNRTMVVGCRFVRGLV